MGQDVGIFMIFWDKNGRVKVGADIIIACADFRKMRDFYGEGSPLPAIAVGVCWLLEHPFLNATFQHEPDDKDLSGWAALAARVAHGAGANLFAEKNVWRTNEFKAVRLWVQEHIQQDPKLKIVYVLKKKLFEALDTKSGIPIPMSFFHNQSNNNNTGALDLNVVASNEDSLIAADAHLDDEYGISKIDAHIKVLSNLVKYIELLDRQINNVESYVSAQVGASSDLLVAFSSLERAKKRISND